MDQITCGQADETRRGLTPLSSLTNYVGGEVLNPYLPPRTETTWGLPDGTEVMREVIDADGCRHYMLNPTEGEAMTHPDITCLTCGRVLTHGDRLCCPKPLKETR